MEGKPSASALSFLAHGKALSAFGSTAGENPAPVLRGHALAKPVPAGALDATGLIRAFHNSLFNCECKITII